MTDYVISSGMTASYRLQSGDLLTVLSGGVSSQTRVLTGATEIVSSGGEALGDRVYAGAVQVLVDGGVDSGVSVLSGAALALSDQQISSGATLSVGIAAKPTVVSGARLLSGAATWSIDATLVSGGREIVGSEGLAIQTSVGFGASETVQAGGVVLGASIDSGGELSGAGQLEATISDAGIVLKGTIASGAMLDVASGGQATLTRLASGGSADVASGGNIDAIIDGKGGALVVEAGGMGLNVALTGGSTVDDGELLYTSTADIRLGGALSGGGLIVQDGPGTLALAGVQRAFSGSVEIEYGTVEAVSRTAIGSGAVLFLSTPNTETFEVASAAAPMSGATYGVALQDFDQSNEQLDLASVAYTSGATATVSGSDLVVMDGSYTATFVLTGATASAYAVQSDGANGTLVYAVSTTTPQSALVQAAAGFRSQGQAGVADGARSRPGESTAVSLAPSALHFARA